MRTLTLRELNRATLARQLLLERKKVTAPTVIERLAGLQAQWPPSPYIGLWARVSGFTRASLESAILRGVVLKPTVMRGTLHLVTARDYPIFWWALLLILLVQENPRPGAEKGTSGIAAAEKH